MKHILIQAKAEIERLRRENEILAAKVSTMELMATLLHSQPNYPPATMAVDVTWEIQRSIDRLEIEESRPPGANHFCRGASGNGEWSNRSEEVPSICGYCREPNEALIRQMKAVEAVPTSTTAS